MDGLPRHDEGLPPGVTESTTGDKDPRLPFDRLSGQQREEIQDKFCRTNFDQVREAVLDYMSGYPHTLENLIQPYYDFCNDEAEKIGRSNHDDNSGDD
jgi:hypothetical protein